MSVRALVGDRVDDAGMAMADVHRGDAGGHVVVAPALKVVEEHAFAAREGDLGVAVDGRADHLTVAGDPVFRGNCEQFSVYALHWLKHGRSPRLVF
jgi:hypothetical protein